MKELVIASGNAGKLKEFAELFAGQSTTLIPQHALGIRDADETASTFVENALLKARHAAAQSGKAALADDSGLLVDALNGAPGLITARYAGPGANAAANITKLLSEMRDVPDGSRHAHFVAVIVLLRSADDPDPLIAQGRWFGEILHAPRGNAGFGYDPVFYLPSLGKTAAELDSKLKNQLSHRGQAIAQLFQLINAQPPR
jgi:XTP/dITP diphosphohydrolase